MRSAFDRRVAAEPVLELVRACQRRAPAHLAGGIALSGAHLAHRLSSDVDLFCHSETDVRTIVRAFPAIAAESRAEIELLRDASTFVRARARWGDTAIDIDVVHEALADLESPPPPLEGIVLESFADLRAAKLTCLLSRAEPRDLVDVLFLDRAGFPPEADLSLALRKDAGIDPAALAWLLGDFPVRPMPLMLQPLTTAELLGFRDALRERLRRLAVPDAGPTGR